MVVCTEHAKLHESVAFPSISRVHTIKLGTDKRRLPSDCNRNHYVGSVVLKIKTRAEPKQ